MNRLASLVVVVAGAAVLSACQTVTTATTTPEGDAPAAVAPVASGPARVSAEASLGCPGRNAGPAFLFGPRDLASSSTAVGVGSAVSETLVVSAADGADLEIGSRLRPTAIGNAFEMCVITSPPARGAALSAIVSGQLQTTRFAGDADNAFWQGFFDTYFIRPLQLTPTDANGVLKIDVLAGNLRTALASAPSSSGEMLITVSLPDGAHQLSLTVEKQ